MVLESLDMMAIQSSLTSTSPCAKNKYLDFRILLCRLELVS